jgi:hypothetical protein
MIFKRLAAAAMPLKKIFRIEAAYVIRVRQLRILPENIPPVTRCKAVLFFLSSWLHEW